MDPQFGNKSDPTLGHRENRCDVTQPIALAESLAVLHIQDFLSIISLRVLLSLLRAQTRRL